SRTRPPPPRIPRWPARERRRPVSPAWRTQTARSTSPVPPPAVRPMAATPGPPRRDPIPIDVVSAAGRDALEVEGDPAQLPALGADNPEGQGPVGVHRGVHLEQQQAALGGALAGHGVG